MNVKTKIIIINYFGHAYNLVRPGKHLSTLRLKGKKKKKSIKFQKIQICLNG